MTRARSWCSPHVRTRGDLRQNRLVPVPVQDTSVRCHPETVEAGLVLNDSSAEASVVVELTHLEEHERRRRSHTPVREARRYPRDEPAPEVHAHDLEPDDTLERRVTDERGYLANAYAVHVNGGAEHLG